MADFQTLVFGDTELDDTASPIEVPCGAYQKATVQVSNPNLALGLLSIDVKKSVAKGFSNAEAFSSPVAITGTAISGPHDIQGIAYLYISVGTAGTSGLVADITVHLESTVS